MLWTFVTLVATASLLCLVKWYTTKLSNRRKELYHPGPKPLPIIGNALDIPKVSPWREYASWRRQYGKTGDIIHLSALGKHIVVVNSIEKAVDLLDKRSSNYSDRPDIPMANMTGWTAINIGLIHYGELWRRHRRLFHQKFRQNAVSEFRPLQTSKIQVLLHNLLENPEEFSLHVRNFPASVIMAATYGYEIAPRNDPIVTLVDEASTMITEHIFLGSQLVNVFPVLRHIPDWMPGTAFKKIARDCHNKVNEMMDTPFYAVKEQMAKGEAMPSWTSELLQDHDAKNRGEEGEYLIKSVTATAFAVAADTSASSLASFILAMVLYPDVLAKAQAELDSVVGNTRLPNFGDRDSMPYIDALCHEIFRWSPAVPLGVPHAALEDDIYDGRLIPAGAFPYAVPIPSPVITQFHSSHERVEHLTNRTSSHSGTMILSNIWAMSRDERIYDQPSKFMPERFLNADGTEVTHDPLPTFGFGRRICVGRHLADDTLWIAVATMISCFNFTKAKDVFGKEIDVTGEFDDKLISHPRPFKCSITPRSDAAVNLIKTSV
ncbi:cytochrome P450 [Pleurotus eryngii]|uniref:Cytochrome P450 n=1 Tax=Pleurotus eryngii TaxID=5323 RepID=A0A9P5ZPA0_PLEER|nr:cytochrome P450 [Pleurotus eryngii]